MAAIILPRKHYTQPPGRVAYQESLGHITGIITVGGVNRELGGDTYVNSACTNVATPYGTALAQPRNPTGNPKFYIVPRWNPWVSGRTILAYLYCPPGNFATTLPWLISDHRSESSPYFGLIFTSASNREIRIRLQNGTTTSTGYTLPSDGSLVVLGLRIISGGSQLFANGRLVFTHEQTIAWGSPRVGGGDNATWDDCDPIRYLGLFSFPRLLAVSEIEDLSATPWQIFRAEPHRIYSLPPVITIPTLSSPGVIDITANSARPQVTLTY